jgi:hypothetical protein
MSFFPEMISVLNANVTSGIYSKQQLRRVHFFSRFARTFRIDSRMFSINRTLRRLSALPKRNLIDDEEEFEHVQVQRAHRNDHVENLSVNRFPSEFFETKIEKTKQNKTADHSSQ